MCSGRPSQVIIGAINSSGNSNAAPPVEEPRLQPPSFAERRACLIASLSPGYGASFFPGTASVFVSFGRRKVRVASLPRERSNSTNASPRHC